MKREIKIYSNLENNSFLTQIFSKYTPEFETISSLIKNENKSDGGIIFYKQDNDRNNLNFKILKNNYLIISNSSNLLKNLKTNITIITSPISLDQINNYVERFFNNNKIEFEDIYISDKKLFNKNNNKSCFLTDIELEILLSLIRKKISTKHYIKENILNIKTNIETNSIDSHLTRIRKKLEKINASIIIQSKNDKIEIYSNQKMLD